MNSCPDAGLLQVVHQAFAVAAADHIEVIHGARPGRFEWSLDSAFRSRKQALVLVSSLATLGIPLRQVFQLHTQDSSLDCIETPVVSLDVVVILLGLAMIAQHLGGIGNARIIRGDCPTFATAPRFFPG